MVSNNYINYLVKHAKKNENARWKLGEILNEAEMEGHTIVIDRKNEMIYVKEKHNVSE